MIFWADLDAVVADSREAWRPPPRLSLSEWSDEHFYLSAESSAEPGRWTSLPYQIGILDAITDPEVSHVSVMKSARVGYTKCMNAAIGYFIHHQPSSILVVQPTVDGAKLYSKEEIAPMLRDVPVLREITYEEAEDTGPRDGANTILHKRFPGGVLSMIGANSGAGFRSISRRVVIFDEVDAYPPSAGSDGDPIKLGTRRTEHFWNRKIIAGSTPLVAGRSRIEELFETGDRRRYFVPCPSCGHSAPFVFSGDTGHAMTWPKGKPEDAFFTCQKNGCVIEHKDKRAMVTAGEWRASGEFTGHASFHLWAAVSFSPNATWGQIAQEFVEANKGGVEQLKTFVNTVLGETWKDKGDAPEWERLYQRREEYEIGQVPAGVLFLTAGVDVQKDRWVWEVVGWGEGKESWSIDSGVIPGDTSNEADWTKLDALLDQTWQAPMGPMAVRMMAIDSGYNTQSVYNWARRHVGRVLAVKGVSTARVLVGAPTPVDVNFRGKRIARGCKVWPIGVDIAKAEFYGWLRLPVPSKENAEEYPNGFCHFPQYGEGYFKQITAEQLISTVKRTGYTQLEWQLIPGRENHWLDCRVYSRAAAAQCGLDRYVKRTPITPKALDPGPEQSPDRAPPPPRQPGSWLGKSGIGNRNRGKSWLR